jgi:hypothetical protein
LWYIPHTRYSGMQGEAGERWRELCQQAVVEQDSQKLLQLIREINQLLEAKDRRLQRQQAAGKSA